MSYLSRRQFGRLVIGGVVKLIPTIALVKYTNMGIFGVALAGLLAFSIKNGVFNPWYAARILGVPSWPFYKSLIPSVFVYAAASGAAELVARLRPLALVMG